MRKEDGTVIAGSDFKNILTFSDSGSLGCGRYIFPTIAHSKRKQSARAVRLICRKDPFTRISGRCIDLTDNANAVTKPCFAARKSGLFVEKNLYGAVFKMTHRRVAHIAVCAIGQRYFSAGRHDCIANLHFFVQYDPLTE